VVLISLSKHTRKDFYVIITFGHGVFITSQSLFVPTNIVLKRYLACWTFSKCQPYSNDNCLSIYTFIKLMLTIGYTMVSVERCLSRWRCYKYTCEIIAEKNNWGAIAAMILHCNVKVNYSQSTLDFLCSKQHRQLLNSKKAIFEIQHLVGILFP